jgi:hypothetical protein
MYDGGIRVKNRVEERFGLGIGAEVDGSRRSNSD